MSGLSEWVVRARMWRRLGPEALAAYALLVHAVVAEQLWVVPARRGARPEGRRA